MDVLLTGCLSLWPIEGAIGRPYGQLPTHNATSPTNNWPISLTFLLCRPKRITNTDGKGSLLWFWWHRLVADRTFLLASVIITIIIP